jgi:hypothetical protein
MRTKLTAALGAALAAGALVLATATPAPAGDPSPTITVTKVVAGPETAGASYVVTISCIGSGPFSDVNGALNFAAGGGSQVFTLLPPGYEGDCTFIESTTSGATPAYACAVVGDQEGSASCTTPDGAAPATLNVNDPSNGPLATITVTNTFTAAAESVVADPSGFTG